MARSGKMVQVIEIEMVLEGDDEESSDVVIATLTPAIAVTAQDDEETLMDKVYEHIDAWWQRTLNIACTPHYNLDGLMAIAERM
jgi:hypothetical protein